MVSNYLSYLTAQSRGPTTVFPCNTTDLLNSYVIIKQLLKLRSIERCTILQSASARFFYGIKELLNSRLRNCTRDGYAIP